MNAVKPIRDSIQKAARPWLAVLVVGCWAVLPFCSQAQANPAGSSLEQEFQAALAAQDKGDIEGARTILLALHRKHPGIFAVDESLGLLYAQQERYEDARPLLEAAVRDEPSSGPAHVNLGAALYKLHQNQRAIAEFQNALRIDPQNLTAQQSLGQALLDQHKADEAAQAFSAALRLKPGDGDLSLSYAAALVAAKRFDEGARALSDLPATENSALAQSLFGEIDENKGDFKSALRHFARAQELEPSEDNAWALGVELLRHWTFDTAIREFEAAAAKFPQSTRMRFGLGAAYFGDSKFAAAVPVFAGLLESDKDNALWAELLGMSCTSVSGSTDRSQCGGLLAYAEAHPRDAKAAAYAASMLLNDTATDEQLKTARRLLERALGAEPKLPDAQYQMGLLKQNTGDWSGSVAHLEEAVRLKPDFAQAHYRLALAYWRTGRKQDGQTQMELQKKYSKQQQEDLNNRLRQITTFVITEPK